MKWIAFCITKESEVWIFFYERQWDGIINCFLNLLFLFNIFICLMSGVVWKFIISI